MAEININIAQVEAQAKKLDEIAAQIKGQTITRLEKVTESAKAAWTGDAAVFFTGFMTNGYTSLGQFVQALKGYAETLCSIAQEARRAEEMAKRQANQGAER